MILCSFLFFFFFLMTRPPPRSTPFPTRRSSDLLSQQFELGNVRQQSINSQCEVNWVTTFGKAESILSFRKSRAIRSEEHTSELRHMSISYAVFCLKKKKKNKKNHILSSLTTSIN